MSESLNRAILIAVATALFTCTFLGCASTPNPFLRLTPDYTALPAGDLEAAAQEIEAAVARGDRDFAPANRGGVVMDTPEIKQALRQRAARYELVEALIASGYAAETDSGLMNMVTTSDYKKSTTKRERDRNALVVYSENQNRWTLYEGILKASNFPPRALSAIQETFYKVRIAN